MSAKVLIMIALVMSFEKQKLVFFFIPANKWVTSRKKRDSPKTTSEHVFSLKRTFASLSYVRKGSAPGRLAGTTRTFIFSPLSISVREKK